MVPDCGPLSELKQSELRAWAELKPERSGGLVRAQGRAAAQWLSGRRAQGLQARRLALVRRGSTT